MNNKISIRQCGEYDIERITLLIGEIYRSAGGPDPSGKKILLKPNILTDTDPDRCVTTHPVFVEAAARFFAGQGSKIFIGDSPSIHLPNFMPVKSGISEICKRTGATWVDFRKSPTEKRLGKARIKVASVVDEVDLIISLPKFKNHELVYFTGAIKNTLGLVPGFTKGKQHALYQNRNRFGEFLVDLNEAVLPDFFLMDGITGMEGPGPANGFPRKIGLIIGSTNPLAIDIIASSIAGYNPLIIPTNRTALSRKTWLTDEKDILIDGPDPELLKIRNFTKIPVSTSTNISMKFVMGRIRFLRKLERRPVFLQENCTACHRCVNICPVDAISPDPDKDDHIILTDSKCIRCFCCNEVCMDNAIEIRRKLFGV